VSYIPGDFWRICDRCGFKVRSSRTAKEWTGLMVCRDTCFETRHPQDFVRAAHDRQVVRDARPEHSEYVRMDLERITIDDTSTRIDQRGDAFLDTNEVQPGDL
jgi:hypothetical protein